MRFWDIDRLKRDLHVAPLAAPQALAYVIAYFVLWIVGTTLPAGTTQSVDIPDITPLRWVIFAVNVVGLYLAYRANGGSSGPDLAARVLALSWVISVRLFVFLGLASLAGLLAYIAWMYRGSSDPLTTPGALLSILAVGIIVPQLLLYWRLVHHIGTIDDAPIDTSSAAA